MPIITSVVPVSEIFELRWSVLRPGLPRATAAFPEDGAAGVFHLAAYPSAAPEGQTGAGAPPAAAPHPVGDAVPSATPAAPPARTPPLACVTFFPDPLPPAFPDPLPPAADARAPRPAAGASYRFRGLASAPAARGRGYGVAVLRAGLAEAAARGARWAWCNGRTGARGFYERQGFTAVGEEFDLAPSGRHLVFVIEL
ncbi:GNAT family N-acetyltransferase [Streptomyces sp. 796.1]|uniref:GNAT family N-acetyltransferase n=1 Tax=Streptomyces sp. 796.1 TaxID=3163029 RepID=UPI0039C9148C